MGTRVLSRRERRRLAATGPQPDVPTASPPAGPRSCERHPKVLARSPSWSCRRSPSPTLSLRLGASDQGNHPEATTTRQAYDLLAEGFGPGFNGPLTLVGSIDGAEDRGLTRLATTLRTTEGVA